jgi:histone-lysine N-methyltransferase SETD3
MTGQPIDVNRILEARETLTTYKHRFLLLFSNHHKNTSEDAFVITSLTPLVAGQQVFDSYGIKCNHRYLLNYGFAIEKNVEDDGTSPNEVQIQIKLTFHSNPQLRTKQILASRAGFEVDPWLRLSAQHVDKHTAEVLSCLRFAAADKDELSHIINSWERANKSLSSFDPLTVAQRPMSVRNETMALGQLQSVLIDMLDKYPKTLEEDERELASSALAPFR